MKKISITPKTKFVHGGGRQKRNYGLDSLALDEAVEAPADIQWKSFRSTISRLNKTMAPKKFSCREIIEGKDKKKICVRIK